MHLAPKLMGILRKGIAENESLADELDRLAEAVPPGGRVDVASGLRAIVRNHRIRAMALRGRLGALEKEHGDAGAQG